MGKIIISGLQIDSTTNKTGVKQISLVIVCDPILGRNSSSWPSDVQFANTISRI